jgi:uncharacterized protein YdeI (YjbR/CyaY-like superfamily)
MSEEYDAVEVTSRDAWRRWLQSHHGSSRGVWVTTYKKAAGERYVPYDDIAEEALAFGWIDSRRRSVDEQRSQLLVTPRKPRSGWSRINKERVERLEAAGLMTEAGRRAIAVAKENGAWSALDDIENLVEPDDLREELDANPEARRHWDAFPRSAKRAILDWIAAAKRDETRRRRVSETARLAAQNVRANEPAQR